MKGIFRVVQLSMKQVNGTIEPQALAIFADFEKNLWTEQDRSRYNCQYPDFAAVVRSKGDVSLSAELEMDALLDRWGDLKLSEG